MLHLSTDRAPCEGLPSTHTATVSATGSAGASSQQSTDIAGNWTTADIRGYRHGDFRYPDVRADGPRGSPGASWLAAGDSVPSSSWCGRDSSSAETSGPLAAVGSHREPF